MTTTLYWRPTPKDQPAATDLPYPLKRPLAQRYWNHDGSLYGDAIELTRPEETP